VLELFLLGDHIINLTCFHVTVFIFSAVKTELFYYFSVATCTMEDLAGSGGHRDRYWSSGDLFLCPAQVHYEHNRI